MNKRKKASSSASRSARGSHLLGPPRAAAPRAAHSAARGTKSNSAKGSDSGSRKTAARKEAASNTLALAAGCTVSDAGSLKERLAGLLQEPQAVTLDVTALQLFVAGGLQVITAF